jgi:hypothetical protein
MKKLIISIVIIWLSVFTSLTGQIKIAQWNFNGESDSTVPGGTSAPTPVIGIGTASLIGSITASFASGRASGGSSDTVSTVPPNYAWNTTTYAPAGTENKQRGVEFKVSTVGYHEIKFSFDQRLSNTANNTYIVQYTTNGTNWIDADTFTFVPAETGTGDFWFNNRSVDFSGINGLNNNVNAGFRIVSAFDPTKGDYLAANSTKTYAVSGTVRFDMVTVSGVSTSAINNSSFSDNLTIYPNPVNSLINLSKEVNFDLYDLNGNKILTGEGVSSINVSNFKSGLYILKTDLGEIRKVIKQ